MTKIRSGNMDGSERPMIVEARGVSKSFPLGSGSSLVPVVREVDFQARAGEFISIVGPSGSGKSTLLYCLSGLEKPTGGAVFLGGTSLRGLSEQRLSRLRRDSVGFIFQDYNLIDSLDVQANVELPLRFRKRFDRQGKKLVKETLGRLGVQGLRRHYPADLSGGERQRVAIARAMVSRPRVLFADEPTGALDSANTQTVFALLQEMAASGVTVVMVTHDLELAAKTDRSAVLRDGRVRGIVEDPSVSRILELMEDSQGPTSLPMSPAVG